MTFPTSAPQSADIQAIFNQIAPVYDQLNDALSLGLHRVWKHMAVSWCNPQPGDQGLDVCCGSGDLAQLLAQRVAPTGQVTGLDFSAAQLAIAHQRTTQRVQPLSVKWVEGDALALPFEANQFDVATMGYGLRNVVDIPASLRELHRVLKPGATIAILDFHRPDSPPMQAFQQWYLEHLVIPTAERFGLKDQYAYLVPSLERFPNGRSQVHLAKAAGFQAVTHYAIASGMMGVLVARK